MNTYHYKHFSLWERQKLESLIGNKPILRLYTVFWYFKNN